MSMSITEERKYIRINFDGFATHEHQPGKPLRVHDTYPTSHGEVVVTWEWETEVFRLDITVPQPVALHIALPLRAGRVYVNGQAVWRTNAFLENTVGVTEVQEWRSQLCLTCRSGGAYHVLAVPDDCAGT